MRRSIRLVGLLVATGLVASCAAERKSTSTAAESVRSEAAPAAATKKEKEASRRQDEDSEKLGEYRRPAVEDLVRTNNRFAFDVLRALGSGNVVASPLGLESTLAIAYAGADGETREEIGKTARFAIAEPDVHQKFAQLAAAIDSRRESLTNDQRRGFRLHQIDAVWYASQIAPKSRFLRIAHSVHGAAVQKVGFGADPDAARNKINGFVHDATSGRVAAPLDRGRVTRFTSLVLTDAVTYDAPWTVPFARAATHDVAFAGPSGSHPVPTMHGIARLRFFDGDGFEVLDLPYGDGRVVATVFLPDDPKADLESGLTADYFDWMVKQMRPKRVDVELPRFSIDSKFAMRSILGTLGMKKAFDPKDADFGRIAPSTDQTRVYLGAVVHQARIAVNEDGSDAAGPTGPTSTYAGSQPAAFHASHPFLVIVRDQPTGAILLVARVIRP